MRKAPIDNMLASEREQSSGDVGHASLVVSNKRWPCYMGLYPKCFGGFGVRTTQPREGDKEEIDHTQKRETTEVP